jgi:hypothetical protein
VGTSQSSPGSPSGVPLVPPWVPAPPPPPDPENDDDEDDEEDAGEDSEPAAAPGAPPIPQSPLAPAGRFGRARQSLRRFAQTGRRQDLRKGLGNYIRTGLGGSAMAVRRMAGTSATARALYEALLPTGDSSLDRRILAGRSAQEVLDAVLEAARPSDGTQDAEANRKAIGDALSALLTRFPDADLLNLVEDQRAFAIEQFIALDVFNRFQLDVGMAVQDNAATASVALARLSEIRDYIREAVASVFRSILASGKTLGGTTIGNIVQSTLRETFAVFEGYV